MTANPTRYPTLLAALADRAGVDDHGYHHYTREGQDPEVVSFAALHRRVQRVAAALQERGVRRGDRVGLILPDSVEFVDAIFGAMLAGAIPVPVYPPLGLGKLDTYLDNTAHILRRAGCSLVLTDGRVRPVLGTLMSVAGTLRGIDVFRDLAAGVPDDATPQPVDVGPDDVAFLQFTSGSTAAPKGVMLTHRNLAHNIEAIGGAHGLRIGEGSSAVSWLPLYHDMGLIGFVFTPIYFRTRGVRFLSPLMFLKRPAVWLRHLSDFRATITFAPNFAYGLATRRATDEELDGVDLSALQVAGCGAEPIQYPVLRGFADRHAGRGFRSTAFLPCYGMAEHSLAITFGRLDDDLAADRVDAGALARGEAAPVSASAAAGAADARDGGELLIVNCGRPFPLHELRIAGEDGETLPERRVGHILVRGPSVMTGYFDDPAATAEALSDGWLRTGDLGYLAGGDLHVCGRIKELIIVEGRNHHPQDIEWQASRVDGIRAGNVIAFGLHDPELGRERVVVAAETRLAEPELAPLMRQVRARILEALALRVDEVLLLPPGALPKTSSGKLQRARARAMFEGGTLGEGAGSSWQLFRQLKQLAASRWSFVKASLRGKD
ncbi:MAG TPA: fatty acyl-AMP ligase [Kofleriaceae bacterium]|nr:fatty acyl-AMP ligase [Kofleriaceae bacterium]